MSLVSHASCYLSMHATIHFATLHYLRNATSLTCTMGVCLVTKATLPLTILGLDHHLGHFHSQSWTWITTWAHIIQK